MWARVVLSSPWFDARVFIAECDPSASLPTCMGFPSGKPLSVVSEIDIRLWRQQLKFHDLQIVVNIVVLPEIHCTCPLVDTCGNRGGLSRSVFLPAESA